MTSGLHLRVTGPLRLWRDGVELDPGPRQQRCLLALLAVRSGRPVSLADLIDLMWDTEPPSSAVNVIHKYVGALRRLFEPGLLQRSPGSYLLRYGSGYRLAIAPGMLDLTEFRRLAGEARVGAAQGRPAEALDRYLAAVAFWHGLTGDGLADNAMAGAAFTGADEEFFAVVTAAAELAVDLRRPAEVLGALRQAAEFARLNETVQASLITTLAAAGQQAEALGNFQAVRARLADELGIDPGPGLRQAQQRVLAQTVLPVAEPGEPPAAAAEPARPFVRPAQLPPDHPLFVGRESELRYLRDLGAEARTSPLVIAVDGMGGVGKSTLVTHFAHLVAAEYTDGQLYLDLRGHEDGVSAADALRSMLYALGVPAADLPDGFDALTGTYRSLTAGQRILVVLDNVRDASQVRPLLPNSADSLILVTSRRPLVELAVSHGAHLLHAAVPPVTEARELLLARLARSRGGDPAAVRTGLLDELLESCGRLPLALAVLAARLSARPRLSLDSVAAALRTEASLETFAGGSGSGDPRTAFSWSYRQLTPGAARLFRLLSVALAAGISIEACMSLSGGDRHRTGDELAELVEAALVDEQPDGTFTSHVLVRAYARELLRSTEPAADRQAAVSRLLQHYLHSSAQADRLLGPRRDPIGLPPPLPGVVPERPSTFPEALDWFARHRELLKEAVFAAADLGYGIAPWHLALSLQQFLEWNGFFSDGEDVMRSALRAAGEQGDVIGEAYALRYLAGARWYAGANEEAIALLHGALEIFVAQDLPAQQGAVRITLHAIHTALGRHDLALAESERAVGLHPGIADKRAELRSLHAQSQSLSRLGRHEEADAILHQALELGHRFEVRIEDASLRVAMAQNLATAGRIDEALAQVELAVEAAEEMGQGPSRFAALRTMAELLARTEDASGAWRAYGRAETVLTSFPDGGPARLHSDLRRLEQRVNRARASSLGPEGMQ